MKRSEPDNANPQDPGRFPQAQDGQDFVTGPAGLPGSHLPLAGRGGVI